MLTKEIAKGRVRPIIMRDLLMNILALNISTFIALPILEDLLPVADSKALDKMLSERRESNVHFILSALQPVWFTPKQTGLLNRIVECLFRRKLFKNKKIK
jgi:hypothetical protein